MIDLIDEELIQLLRRDASQTSVELARQLHVSPATIRRRIRRMKQSGVIHMTVIPNPKLIGLPVVAIIAFQLLHEKAKLFRNALSARKEVQCFYTTSGRFDAIALMWFPSTEHLFDFMDNDVGKIEGIKSTETFVCLHTEKSF